MNDLPANGDRTEGTEPKHNPLPPARILGSPSIGQDAEGEKKNRCRKLRKAPAWIEAACGISLVVITIFYTHYAAKQATAAKEAADAAFAAATVANGTLGEIQKQTTLMKQQLVGSQAALLTLVIDPIDNGILNLGLQNTGHVTATEIHFHLEAAREIISGDRPIGTPVEFDASFEPIKGGDDKGRTWTLPWHPKQLGARGEWPRDWPGNETFKLKGTFSYQDGFGDRVEGEFCQKWLPNFTITNKLQSSGGGGLYPCADFPAAITSVLAQEKQVEGQR